MNSRVGQKENDDARSGIRGGVWLSVLCVALLCVLAIGLSRRVAKRPSLDEAIRQGRSTGPQSNRWRPTHERRAPESVREDRAGLPTPLTAEEARSVACRLANEKARELYECEPFVDGLPASFDGTDWIWSGRRAKGHADIEATVRLAADGSARSVDVLLLVFPPRDF